MNLENKILQITKPEILLDELSIVDMESPENQQVTTIKPSKVLGSFFPYIVINAFEFAINDVIFFELINSEFIPSIRVRVRDNTGMFMGRHFPKDGDVLSFWIRANNENTFKPIRIDFDILNIDPDRTSNQDRASTFNIFGQMKVPGLLAENNFAYRNLSSWDTLLNMSEKLGLGFASNESDTDDKMTWINPTGINSTFIKHVIDNSYKDNNSFFHGFIDPYYVFNFININSLFSVDAEVEESEVYVTNTADLGITDDENKSIIPSPMILTNHEQYQGTTKFLVSYKMFNTSGRVFLTNGYSRYVQYFDTETFESLVGLIDPQTTTRSEKYVHLKGRMIWKNDEFVSEGIKDIQVKQRYMGKRGKNMHTVFPYSNMLNYQNMQEIFKMGMYVELESADMTLYRYQNIPVYIFEYDVAVKKFLEDTSVQEEEIPEMSMNKFLSGNYLIAGIDYFWDYPGPIRQRLTLIRREFLGTK